MIYSTVQRTIAAGVCDAGRTDSLAACERDGITPADKVTAVWCLDNCGVPGTLWALRYVLPSSEKEAVDALWQFIMVTATRHTGNDHSKTMRLLHNMGMGHTQNLLPERTMLRNRATDPEYSPKDRAIYRLLCSALSEETPLNIRAQQVCEQGMLAATHDTADLNSGSTQRYKSEYALQFKQLRAIFNGEPTA